MKRFISFIILMLSPMVLYCQNSATGLMKISAQKILDLESVEYEFRAERYFPSGHFSRHESHVILKNIDSVEHPSYSVEGKRYLSVNDETYSIHFSRALTDSYLIDYDKKSFEKFSNDMAGVAQLQVMGVRVLGSTFNHFERKKPMGVEEGRVFELEGEKEYGGELCYEVSGIYEGYKDKFYWYIAKSDSLPRGYVYEDGTNEVFMKRKNFNPSTESFILEEPEGFDSRHITERNLDESYATIREADKSGIAFPEGSSVPEWQAKDMQGNTWSSGKLKGKVAVLDFWGIWCAPCIRAMPKVQKLYDQFREAGVEVIGFDIKDKREKITTFLQQNGYGYTIIPGAEEIAAKFKVRSYPTIFIIDQEGKVIHAEKGFRSNAYEEWAEVIKTALNN